MRRASKHFTIRRLMIWVALAGLLLGGGVGAARLKRRADSLRAKAASHARSERYFLQILAVEQNALARIREISERAASRLRDLESDSRYFPVSPSIMNSWRSRVRSEEGLIKSTTQCIENLRRSAAAEARMRRQYERAAFRPWEAPPSEPTKPPEPPAYLDGIPWPGTPPIEHPTEPQPPAQRPKPQIDPRNLTGLPRAEHTGAPAPIA
jgi:hypothetical protein